MAPILWDISNDMESMKNNIYVYVYFAASAGGTIISRNYPSDYDNHYNEVKSNTLVDMMR